MDLIGLGLAGASTTIDFISQYLKREEENRRRKQILGFLENAKYDYNETQNILSEVDRSYNTANLSALNAQAASIQTLLNPDTYQALISSKLLGQRAMDKLKALQDITQWNKKMEAMKFEVPFSSHLNFSNMFASGMFGYMLGQEIGRKPLTFEDKNKGKQLNESE